MDKEQVLVVNEGRMEGIKHLPGFSTDPIDIGKFIIDVLPYAEYMDREEAEKNTEYRQIIPYCVVKHKENFLVYKRTKKGGEGRLHDKYSIGIGGHINPDDGVEPMDAFTEAFSREIDEEIQFPDGMIMDDFTINGKGILYDPSNDVGKVHLGYVVLMEINTDIEDQILPAEDAISELQWLPADKVKEIENLENWSKIVIEGL